MMQKSPHLCQLFLILSVLVCFFVSGDNEVNPQLITLTRRPNIFQIETLQLEREETQNSTGVGYGDGLGFLYHEIQGLVEGAINKIF